VVVLLAAAEQDCHQQGDKAPAVVVLFVIHCVLSCMIAVITANMSTVVYCSCAGKCQ
jgi:hypothetical protein